MLYVNLVVRKSLQRISQLVSHFVTHLTMCYDNGERGLLDWVWQSFYDDMQPLSDMEIYTLARISSILA